MSSVAALSLAACNLGAKPVTYTLTDASQFDLPLEPTGVDTGDVDGDGDLDLVVTGTRGLGVLVNDGSGTFSPDVRTVGAPEGASPSLVDFDGDGDLDLLSALRWDGGYRVPGVSWSDGAGSFGSSQALEPNPPPGTLTDLLPADVDGDGDIDVVAGLVVGLDRHLGVYLNDGTGNLVFATTYPFGLDLEYDSPVFLDVGDVDGDGDEDVVATYSDEIAPPGDEPQGVTMAVVAVNDGTGAFATSGSVEVGTLGFGTVGFPALRPALADLDDDGVLDLAVGGENSVTTMLGDGSGGFGAPVRSTLPTSGKVDFVTPADVDRDGNLDLVGSYAPGAAVIAYGDGTGRISDSHKITTGTESTLDVDLAVTDLEGDGDADIIVIGGNTLGVIENAVSGRPNH